MCLRSITATLYRAFSLSHPTKELLLARKEEPTLFLRPDPSHPNPTQTSWTLTLTLTSTLHILSYRHSNANIGTSVLILRLALDLTVTSFLFLWFANKHTEYKHRTTQPGLNIGSYHFMVYLFVRV